MQKGQNTLHLYNYDITFMFLHRKSNQFIQICHLDYQILKIKIVIETFFHYDDEFGVLGLTYGS